MNNDCTKDVIMPQLFYGIFPSMASMSLPNSTSTPTVTHSLSKDEMTCSNTLSNAIILYTPLQKQNLIHARYFYYN